MPAKKTASATDLQTTLPLGDELTVVTWNINSLRARMEHCLRFLVEWRPDVLCLQETKVMDDQFPLEPFTALGYQVEMYGQKSYNGVAICSLHPVKEVVKGFTGSAESGPEGEEARLIAGTVQGVRILNSYFPNGQSVGSEKFAFKLDYYKRLGGYLSQRHKAADPLILVGDFNVAPEPRDVYDAEALDGTVCYHPQEREALAELRGWGFNDLLRDFEQDAGLYSWWDYRQGAFQRDLGLRIDFIYSTAAMQSRATACWMEREERERDKASDHIPVMASFRL